MAEILDVNILKRCVISFKRELFVLRCYKRELQMLHDPKMCSCHFANHDKENLPTLRNCSTPSFDDSAIGNKRRKRKPPSSNNLTAEVDLSEIESQIEFQQLKEENIALPKQSQEDAQLLKDENTSLRKQLDVSRQDTSIFKDERDSLLEKVKVLQAQVTYSQQLKEMKRLQHENMSLKTEVNLLTNRLITMNLRFEFKFIDHSDEKVFLHTGMLTKGVFDVLLKLLTQVPIAYYAGWAVRNIPPQEQLLLTLMKLKMNPRHFDLAQRFGCSDATVSNIVSTWVLLMHEILFQQLMKNIPSRQKNKKCLPIVFQVLCECRMVLDCVEFFCDKPFTMLKQKCAFSSYKHHCTCKGLVGVAPNGFVTYVSVLYPGSISDKKLVAHCGILTRLIPGDMIITDKGFLIADILPYGVDLNPPLFLTTAQFTPEQVKQTERIARGRVHVERSINKIKNFRILSYIPSEMNCLATEIFQVN